MGDAPDLLDTAYEFAGFQAAASFHNALSGLAVPLLFALAGVAYRIFRVAEDGAVRPLTFYLLGMIVVAWLASPRSSEPSALPHLRAPRGLSLIDGAADAVVRRAIEGVNRDFLTRPFEWERLALLARVARVQDPDLSARLRAFFEECTGPAIARVGPPPSDAARRNPTAEHTGLPYDALVDAAGQGCESTRRDLATALRREVEGHGTHRETLAALSAYSGSEAGDLRALYIDKLVRNAWLRPDAQEGEFEAARRSVGTFRWFDLDRRTSRYPFDGGREVNTLWDIATFPGMVLTELVTGIYAETTQWLSEATESRQRHYLVTTHAPHLYGLSIMVLMALFPIAALYGLLPGKWTALLQFCKIFFSVKLWPFGWSLLTAFTERRPGALALADAASDLGAQAAHSLRLGETPNLFVTITLLYLLVPAFSFAAVQLVTHAASLPIQSAFPRTAGGNPGAGAGQAVAALAE